MAENTKIIELKDGFTRRVSATSSQLTEARTKLTATELKIFYQVSTLIEMNDTNFNEFEINVADFCKTLQLNDTNRKFVVNVCKKLLKQTFEIEQENGDWLGYTIFSRMHYKHKEQKIAMKFNEEMRPFLLKLKQFTKIRQVEYIISFDSKYAIRLYAMLKDYRKMSNRDINLNAFFKMLELPKSYENYNKFRKWVLNPAIKEINAKSDLFIKEIEIIGKIGKKITDIRIHFCNQAHKVAMDITDSIRKDYLRVKNFTPFVNLYCYPWDIESCKEFRHLIKIARIGTIDGYICALSEDNKIIFSSKLKGEFLNLGLTHIGKALEWTYKNEKKEQLPTLEWQDNKDKIQVIKNIINQWRNKVQDNKVTEQKVSDEHFFNTITVLRDKIQADMAKKTLKS